MGSLPGKVRMVTWSAILAFLISGFGQGVWGVLLVGNLKTSPAFPWAVPVMALVLWLMWQYLGGGMVATQYVGVAAPLFSS